MKKESAPVARTMRTRSGLHIINPRKVKSNEKISAVSVTVVGVDGKSAGKMSLPGELFAQIPNKTLIAQAVRVYLANQRQGTASTKKRGEVKGSTRKIYRQKGTGRARHGASKAPIFVGGGIVFGPTPRDFSLKFPKKMRKVALVSALSEKASQGKIMVIDGDFSGKTKEVALLLKTLELDKKGNADRVLVIVDGKDTTSRAVRNIGGIDVENASTLSTYGVVISKTVLFMKSAVGELEKRLSN